jgi:hypothetical protein
MNNRAFAITIFLVGAVIITSAVRAAPPAPRYPKTMPFQGAGGRDISENAWQNWQAPVGTVDPSKLIPENSADSAASNGISLSASDSFQLAKSFDQGKPIQVEQIKPSEKFETENTGLTDHQSVPLLGTTSPKTKSDSKRIVMVAAISVAVLAYRKFRRAQAGRHPPKPNFL